jgi:hypothetical protein
MSTIVVENGGMFELTNPNLDMKELERELEEHKKTVIRAASPFMDGMRIFNKTKHCEVLMTFTNGKVVITIKNPDDEVFNLNDPEPTKTPYDQNGDLKPHATTERTGV